MVKKHKCARFRGGQGGRGGKGRSQKRIFHSKGARALRFRCRETVDTAGVGKRELFLEMKKKKTTGGGGEGGLVTDSFPRDGCFAKNKFFLLREKNQKVPNAFLKGPSQRARPNKCFYAQFPRIDGMAHAKKKVYES